LDQKDIALSYQKVKAMVQSSKIQMETAKSNFDRIKKLYQSNNSSLSEYENARNAYISSKSNYESAVNSIDLQASQFDYARIKAPTSGIITQVLKEVNEFAQAGMPAIVMNAESIDLEVKIGVPEKYISKIVSGDRVKIDMNGKQFKGIVTEIGFSATASVTYPVIVKILNPNKDLRPGMPAKVSFTLNKNISVDNQLVAPSKSVSKDDESHFVYVLNRIEESKVYEVEKRKVVIGPLTNQGFVISSGVKNGELVATAGISVLYEGRKVLLLN
jgi:RND family efflux transporter MFP subunit